MTPEYLQSPLPQFRVCAMECSSAEQIFGYTVRSDPFGYILTDADHDGCAESCRTATLGDRIPYGDQLFAFVFMVCVIITIMSVWHGLRALWRRVTP